MTHTMASEMKALCYYCGAPATSREHVPPACLFPEAKDLDDRIDYRTNLITVPSCDDHNSNKSKDDEYLQLVLIHGYFNNASGRAHYNSKVVRALTRRPAMLFALFEGKQDVVVDAVPTVAVDIDVARFDKALEQITKGLCVFQNGWRWPHPIQIYTPVLLAINVKYADGLNGAITQFSKVANGLLDKLEKRGDNPDIFWYQLEADKAKDRLLCRMTFYGGFDIFAFSDPALQQKALSIARQRGEG